MNLCKDVREMLGMNQREWARWMGCNYRSISRWEIEGVPASIARQVMNGIYESINVVGLAKVRERVRWGCTNLIFHSITGWHLEGLPRDVAEPDEEEEEKRNARLHLGPPRPTSTNKVRRKPRPRPVPGSYVVPPRRRRR